MSQNISYNDFYPMAAISDEIWTEYKLYKGWTPSKLTSCMADNCEEYDQSTFIFFLVGGILA